MAEEKNVVMTIRVLIVFVILFVAAAFLIRQNIAYVNKVLISSLPFSVTAYIILSAIDAIFIPIIIPLIPIASNLYGFVFASLYLIIGWIIGIVISFYIARKFGRRIVGKFVSLKKIDEFEKSIPEHRLFTFIFLMRIFLPLDIVSYGFGIFKKVNVKKFFLASFLGIIPPAILLSYAGNLSLNYEATGLILGILIAVLIGTWFYQGRKR